jgi:hypothetical protein
MFEVITESQPHDYQSLEILKEAYSKLGRDQQVIATSKRIAQAYMQMGQLSSAILEYETILQRAPDDPDVQQALKQIESKATSFPTESLGPETVVAKSPVASPSPNASPAARNARPMPGKAPAVEVEDGRRSMHKIFVQSKVITSGDFDLCWTPPDMSVSPNDVVEPFVQRLADKGVLPVEKALKLLCDHSRAAFLQLAHYDIDLELARTFPVDTCRRWCLFPFDRMSKSILVATANPFNQQAAKELSEATPNRLLWYVVTPAELVKNLRKAFR